MSEPMTLAERHFPNSWQRVRLLNVASVNPETLPETTDPDFTFKYIDIAAVSGNGVINLPEQLVSFSEAPSRARRIVQPGDILVSTVRTYLRAIARVTDEGCIASTGFAVIRAGNSVDGDFLYWWLRSHPFVEQVVAQSVGVSYPAINASALAHFTVPLPSLEVQRIIAERISTESATIDELIAEQERQRALLFYRRTAFLKYMVCGRFAAVAPNELAPYWLGPVPTDWGTYKVGATFRTGSGTTPQSTNPDFYGGAHPWVNTSELRECVVSQTGKTVTDLALNEHTSLAFYEPGSLVIAMYGATIGRLGLLGIRATVNQACCVLHSPTAVRTKFAFYWFWAHQAEIASMGQGGGQPNINQEMIRGLRIPAPAVEEQDRIVSVVEAELTEMDRLASEMTHQIALLHERRRAFIEMAITGQLEVA